MPLTSGMDQTLILFEDLHRTIEYMYKGMATVTFYTNESNASIWEIRGHKKELVVMLHYQNGCKEANEIIDTEDTVFIKEEPTNVVNMCHQNKFAQDIKCMDDAKVVVHMSEADNSTCQPTKGSSLQSTTCTSSEEAVSVQPTTFNDVSNEETVSDSYKHIKSRVDTDSVADKNSILDVLDSTSHLVKEYISQSTRYNCASTEEAIPVLDMVCSIIENVSGELGYTQNVKSEYNHVIIDGKINYGQSCHSNCETVPEINKNLDTTPQIEPVCNSNNTNTSQKENENILVEMQSVKLKKCFVLLKPLDKNKFKINNLSSVQERGTFTNTDEEVTDEGNGSSVECSKCEKRFIIKDNLGSLNQIQTTDNIHLCSCCVITGNKFKYKKSLKIHEDSHNGIKSYKCSLCNKKFNLKANLKRHMVIHSVVKPHECSQCNKKFNWRAHLKLHEAIHTGVKPHECSVCNKKFNRKDQLIQHEVIHSEVKPFECSQCNKKFNWKYQLKLHEAIHSGVKPFECSQCNKKFNWKYQLKLHEAIHSGVKFFECSQCNKKFNWKVQLMRHEAIHSRVKPFECSQCNEKFNWKYQLKLHEAIHSGVKPFECSQCNEKFNWKAQLKLHEAIHSGVKSHECSHCNKKFYLYQQLRRHKLTHSAVYRKKYCK